MSSSSVTNDVGRETLKIDLTSLHEEMEHQFNNIEDALESKSEKQAPDTNSTVHFLLENAQDNERHSEENIALSIPSKTTVVLSKNRAPKHQNKPSTVEFIVGSPEENLDIHTSQWESVENN